MGRRSHTASNSPRLEEALSRAVVGEQDHSRQYCYAEAPRRVPRASARRSAREASSDLTRDAKTGAWLARAMTQTSGGGRPGKSFNGTYLRHPLHWELPAGPSLALEPYRGYACRADAAGPKTDLSRAGDPPADRRGLAGFRSAPRLLRPSARSSSARPARRTRFGSCSKPRPWAGSISSPRPPPTQR